MKSIIVIPIYKKQLSEAEVFSVNQCFRILGNHPICFVAPEGLDLTAYSDFTDKIQSVQRFDNDFFQNIAGYNQLMLSKEFYQRFLDYEFMLIYQPDCYVFRDELDYWCSQSYDYIGAPWLFEEYYKLPRLRRKLVYLNNKYNIFHNPKQLTREDIYLKVGNGGFSLRRIKKFINALDNKYLELFKSNDNASLYNEDVFWSVVAKNIKKPSFEIGSRFSLDPGARRGFRVNNYQLPFGCHAWDRDINFWEQFIKM